MASIFGSIEGLIHDTADKLVQSNITGKVSDMYTGFISQGFGLVNESLKIVRDITAPTQTPPGP
jgi:hypothetical protein